MRRRAAMNETGSKYLLASRRNETRPSVRVGRKRANAGTQAAGEGSVRLRDGMQGPLLNASFGRRRCVPGQRRRLCLGPIPTIERMITSRPSRRSNGAPMNACSGGPFRRLGLPQKRRAGSGQTLTIAKSAASITKAIGALKTARSR